MLTIKENVNNTITINKSTFITYLYQVDNINQINNYTLILKNKYKDATHHCYAYIIDNIQKCSDDKEPHQTAGKPMLDTLKKSNLNHILCITIRYFGGIKLGTGPLTRAYIKSVKEALEKTNIVNKKEAYLIEIETDIKNKNIEKIINPYIQKKIYSLKIKYILLTPLDFLNTLIQNNIEYKIIEKKFIID